MDYNTGTVQKSTWYDEQLYMILIHRALPDSKAMKTIKNIEDLVGRRGAVALFRIAHECKGHRGELRMDALRDAVREPKPIPSYAEALSHIASWKSAVRRFEKEFPDEHVSSYEKGKLLKGMMPEDLRHDIMKLEKRTYDSIHGYVLNQIPLRMEEELRKKGKQLPLCHVDQRPDASDVPVPEVPELDPTILAALSLIKGSRRMPNHAILLPINAAFDATVPTPVNSLRS